MLACHIILKPCSYEVKISNPNLFKASIISSLTDFPRNYNTVLGDLEISPGFQTQGFHIQHKVNLNATLENQEKNRYLMLLAKVFLRGPCREERSGFDCTWLDLVLALSYNPWTWTWAFSFKGARCSCQQSGWGTHDVRGASGHGTQSWAFPDRIRQVIAKMWGAPPFSFQPSSVIIQKLGVHWSSKWCAFEWCVSSRFHTCECRYEHATVYVWRSEDNYGCWSSSSTAYTGKVSF